MIAAVLFDLDATLYDYAPCNEAGLVAAHARLARERTVSSEEFRALHDAVRAELAHELRGQAASHERALFFKRIVERLGPGPGTALALTLNDVYWEAFLDCMRPAPHAHEVLAELSASLPIALVSNHTTAVQLRKIERLGLEPFLTAVVTSEEVGVEKPDARIFAAALEAVGEHASNAVMIGDDPAADIAGARAVGLRTVQSREFDPRPAPEGLADVVVSALGEVPAALRQWSSM
jgi:putative hydrolase of the HAD superfamily